MRGSPKFWCRHERLAEIRPDLESRRHSRAAGEPATGRLARGPDRGVPRFARRAQDRERTRVAARCAVDRFRRDGIAMAGARECLRAGHRGSRASNAHGRRRTTICWSRNIRAAAGRPTCPCQPGRPPNWARWRRRCWRWNRARCWPESSIARSSGVRLRSMPAGIGSR